MRFLIDAQLPPALARYLSEAGHKSEHVVDVGLADAGDSQIWDYAFEFEAIIITKDEDFASRIILNPKGPAIVWIRKGNCTNPRLLHWFKPLLQGILEKIKQSENSLK